MTAIPPATPPAKALDLTDLEPSSAAVLTQFTQGLSKSQKTLPTSYLYDEKGSELFDAITELPEYYPTRTELSIMDAHLPAMATAVGPEAVIIEYGSGTGQKTRRLLRALERPVAYVPVEISREFLMASAATLNTEFPQLEVLPVCADFTQPFEVPTPSVPARRRVLYFPGSTIGNFYREVAVRLLAQMREEVGPGGAALLGVDLKKDPTVLEAAYNDAANVTASFNLNLLERANRDLHTDFDLSAFRHQAIWNETRGAIEMHLFATRATAVTVGGQNFTFAEGESIHTEDSHKYGLDEFAAMAEGAGLHVEQVWTDPKQFFSVQYLVAR